MIRKWLKAQKKPAKQQDSIPSALEVLIKGSPFVKTEEERADMTIACRDSDYIPKVNNAGTTKKVKGKLVQIMHNGLQVKKGGYYGDWMERIIKELRGHHEPQEEKVFYEIMKHIKSGSVMVELGSFWAYYSLWFNKTVKNAVNICCEPDPNNMEIGKFNAALNNASLIFINTAAGEGKGKFIDFPLESEPGKTKKVPILSVDEMVQTRNLGHIDILHMDVQGQEVAALRGAKKTISSGKLRFLVVSTHHFSISGDPLTHFKCLEFIKSLGGHVIANHTVLESFSGDGLIAASFGKGDRNLHIDVSINSSTDSLYEPYEKDLAKMIDHYDLLRKRIT